MGVNASAKSVKHSQLTLYIYIGLLARGGYRISARRVFKAHHTQKIRIHWTHLDMLASCTYLYLLGLSVSGLGPGDSWRFDLWEERKGKIDEEIYFHQSVPLAGGQAYCTTEREPLPLCYAILASRLDVENLALVNVQKVPVFTWSRRLLADMSFSLEPV